MIPFLHRFPQSSQADHPLWLVVLADMMTNLMLFFLVMYALSLQGPQAQKAMARAFDAGDVVAKPRADEELKLKFMEAKAAADLKALFGDVTVDERAIRVRLQNHLLFPSAGSALAPEAAQPLAKLARVLGEMPNAVIVEGHTDDVPLAVSAYKSNWELSVARSYSVIERLVSEGVAPARLVASGYGEHRPVASNGTPDGRAANRRVEILILRGTEGRR